MKKRYTGVSGTINALLPVQAKNFRIGFVGQDLPGAQLAKQNTPDHFGHLTVWQAIRLSRKSLPDGRPRIWHVRRDPEMMLAIFLRDATSSGIRPNMTVISGFGLVGVVKVAYANSALVQLASDPAFKIGARIAGSQQIGILSGQGSRTGFLQLLDNSDPVKVGDAILARGSVNSRPFVPGVPIGEVTSVDNSASAITQTAEVKFYTNFTTLGVVAVVVSAPSADPRDALVPAKPKPTPTPTVTVTVTPSPTPSSNG